MSKKKRERSPSIDTPELAALTNYIRERKCVLFVGAGLSRAAGLPDWGSLMRSIVDTTKLASATPGAAQELETLFERGKYIELADQCRELLGPAYFHKLLRQLLGKTVQPTELHRAIVETPYACVVTTNFDTLLEDAYARHSGRGLPRTPTGTELANQGTLLLDGAFFILKAHGTLQHDQSMVFTADDYRRLPTTILRSSRSSPRSSCRTPCSSWVTRSVIQTFACCSTASSRRSTARCRADTRSWPVSAP